MVEAFRDPQLQPLRLISGLVLFAFAASHFVNHAVGLIGLDAANAVQDWRLAATQSTAGRILLPLAAFIHIGLGLGKLAARRTLRMPRWEWLQIASGILVPILLIPHVVAITYFANRSGYFYSYTSVAYAIWPAQALWQSALLLVVWLHGCIGLNYWLRTKRWYGAARLWLLVAAVAVPLLALTGFLSAAREAHGLLADPAALAAARSSLHWPDAAVVADMLEVRSTSWAIYGGVLALVVLTLTFRHLAARRAPSVAVSYAGGPSVRAAIGSSLLEISRMHGIPHASVCGGRARCSTCRVHVDQGADAIAPPEPVERTTLQRIGAPPNVRLACQLRPTTDIVVTRLVTPSAQATTRIRPGALHVGGVEKQVAILFLDVRGFTRMSENRLPFDIVFLLNQFFAAVGEAIRSESGWIDKYMGDGLMAVFGHDTDVATGCRQALRAARAIDLALDGLNQRLSAEIADGIRIGIGIHAGPVVIGRIGDTDSAALTVIGRTVNEASRLEALTKEKGCQLILSRTVAEHAGLAMTAGAGETIDVRGSTARIDIVMIAAARDLPRKEPEATEERVSA
jgi:adenylate cyclase